MSRLTTRRYRTADTRKAGAHANAAAGLTLVEVLMSLMVTGIGVLGVVALLPLAFVRAVQATNLTNGTILRYNAESMIDYNPRLLLRWQAQQQYSNSTAIYDGSTGDVVLVANSPGVAFQCTGSGTSGIVAPAWNTTVGGTTNDGSCTWKTVQTATLPPGRFVIDPLGWNALNSVGLAATLGNAAPPGLVPPNVYIMPRFNGELTSQSAASLQVTSPDSWVEQARGPVTGFTTSSATLTGPDLLSVGVPPAVISRVVLIDATGKLSQTRLVTSVTTPVTAPTVNWSTNDQIPATFTPVTARIETEEMRYTWMLTVIPSSGGGSSNVEVTVFFNRPQVAADEQIYTASGTDGVQTPFTVSYSGTKPFVKKGGFLFDCINARWYRVVNVTNDTGSQLNVFVDQPRPAADVTASQQAGMGQNFAAMFMRGVVDVFPLPLK